MGLRKLPEYGMLRALASYPGSRKEVSRMENLLGFLMSVIAGVAANYISKRLDRGGRNR